MRREFTIQSKVDGLVLDGLVVEPEEGVQRTALLQLSHGMSEYKERYLPFMEYMAEHILGVTDCKNKLGKPYGHTQ